ncbi:MAG: PilZ domain-containing protein [Bdellovibrionaceae bacterium]|nr:PilZ domain-containing protein [Bdellovibrionales bacterium]MCB9083878.1 PilZ domain-containing protein [Pseudobdellovibrionaceae bacterium]
MGKILKGVRVLRRHLSRWFYVTSMWAIKRLPDAIQGKLIRRQLHLPLVLPGDMVFKIADTKEEFAQALALVYEAYLEQGLISCNQHAQRFTKYHASPFSTVIVGKWQDEVVATLTVIVDSPLGLPADAGWDLDDLRRWGDRVAEISSLAIKRGWRRKRGFILMPLVKFLYEYAIKYAGVDRFVAVTNESARFFYRHILLFEDLEPKSTGKSYQFVKTNCPWGMTLNLRRARGDFRRVSVGKGEGQNIFRFFCERQFAGFHYPERSFFKSLDPVLAPHDLRELLKCGVLGGLEISDPDREFLRSAYHFQEFKQLIPMESPSVQKDRQHPRFPVRIKGQVNKSGSQRPIPIEIFEVSEKGLMIRLSGESLLLSNMTLRFLVSPWQSVEVEAQPVWCKPGGIMGLRIHKVNRSIWGAYMQYLEGDLKREASLIPKPRKSAENKLKKAA